MTGIARLAAEVCLEDGVVVLAHDHKVEDWRGHANTGDESSNCQDS